MDTPTYRISVIAALAAAAIAFFFSVPVAAGIITGTAFFAVYMLLLTKDIDDQIAGGPGPKLLTTLARMVRLLVFAVALAIGAVWPDYVNIFGIFGGLMAFKIVTIIDAAIKKG